MAPIAIGDNLNYNSSFHQQAPEAPNNSHNVTMDSLHMQLLQMTNTTNSVKEPTAGSSSKFASLMDYPTTNANAPAMQQQKNRKQRGAKKAADTKVESMMGASRQTVFKQYASGSGLMGVRTASGASSPGSVTRPMGSPIKATLDAVTH